MYDSNSYPLDDGCASLSIEYHIQCETMWMLKQYIRSLIGAEFIFKRHFSSSSGINFYVNRNTWEVEITRK